MSEAPPENSNGDFIHVNSASDMQAFMHECLRTGAPLVLWPEGQDTRYHGKFDVHPIAGGRAYSVILAGGVDPEVVGRSITDSTEPFVYFSVSLTKANIFYRTGFLGYADGLLLFEMPAKIFKVQRRKNMRFQIREGYVLRFSFAIGGLELSKKIYDLSAGGISFLVNSSDEALFQVGLPIKNAEFEIKGRKINIDGIVKHSVATRKKDGFKVGVQFTRIAAEDAEAVERFVISENVRFMARDM